MFSRLKSHFYLQLTILLLLIALFPNNLASAAFLEQDPADFFLTEDHRIPGGLTQSDWDAILEQLPLDLTQEAYLKASNTDAGDYFGYSVAISGDTIVVGAIVEDSSATGVNGNQDDNSASDAGAAYVFQRSGSTWSQQAYLKASNTDASDYFGVSVAISGDTIVVGASGEGSSATGVNGNQDDNSASAAGAAYVFSSPVNNVYLPLFNK